MVSVILPNYNHVVYLKERIESILNQTYQNFELILLDDCSADNSCDILNAYKEHPKVSALMLNEKNTGNTAVMVFALAIILAFLFLAAQYNSWSMPFAVLLIAPMALLSAIVGVWVTGSDNNIFTQIGFVVLVGLAAKNAILIVEFARAKEDEGLNPFDAVLEAARLRLRPILMTSIAFIAGVIPLVLATGAGAEMRHAMGIAVFSGMLGVTIFGLLFTPIFYVVIRNFILRREQAKALVQEGSK